MRQKIMLGVAVLLVGGAAFNAYQRFGPAGERAAIAQEKADRAARRAAADAEAEAAEHASMADALLVRELARQSIRIAAERGGLAIDDATLASRAAPGAPKADLDATVTSAKGKLTFRVARGGTSAATFDVPATLGPGELIPYEAIVAGLAPHLDAELAEAVVSAGGRAPGAIGTAPLPAGVDAMLVRPNPFDAFRAARLIHRAVAADGTSPARLAGLARAYATLGESTRPLLSAHAQAAFARALIYAEQLVAARPDEAASYWARAYVRAVLGVPGARGDVERARKLGGDAPGWATLTAALVDGDTGALFAAAADAGGPDGALAAHFAMRTVEFSRLDAVVVRLAEVALERDPADLRAMFVAIDNAGVSRLHDFTVRYPLLLNRAFAAAGRWPEVTASPLAAAFDRARSAAYDADARLALWAALDAAPADAGGPRWGTLADLGREASFMLAQRRLDFVARKWSVDAGGDLDDWWPVIKDHPAAPILATYANRGDRAALARVPVDAARDTFVPLAYRVRDAGLAGAVDYNGWFARINGQLDHTLYSVGLDTWASFYAQPRDGFVRQARRFFAAAPEDPTAIAMMLRANWAAMRDREAAYAELAVNAPQVAWALGDRAAFDRDNEKACRYYELAAKLAPTGTIYFGLADARYAMGDGAGSIRALETFLAEGQDVGLQFDSARSKIAEQLLLAGEAKRALAYAESAATSYAGWALGTYAETLMALGRHGEARDVWQRMVERYGESHAYSAFLPTLVYRKAADATIEASVRRQLAAGVAAGDAEWRRRQPVVQAFDGQLDAAAATLADIDEFNSGRYGMTVALASVHLMRDDRAAARAVIDRLAALRTGETSAYSHARAATAAAAVLDGGPPPEPEAADSVLWLKSEPLVRGADACLIGLACERAGHVEAAKAWYVRATRCTGIAPGRVYAAMRLRELGDEAFK